MLLFFSIQLLGRWNILNKEISRYQMEYLGHYLIENVRHSFQNKGLQRLVEVAPVIIKELIRAARHFRATSIE